MVLISSNTNTTQNVEWNHYNIVADPPRVIVEGLKCSQYLNNPRNLLDCSNSSDSKMV